jgi:hypothetical protein
MIWNNYIGTDFLIAPKMCADIIALGENKLYDHGHNEINGRKDTTLELNIFGSYADSVMYKTIEQTITDCTKEWVRKFGVNKNLCRYYNRCHKFQKAEADGGFYSWHYEASEEHSRAFVWMLYLNTVKEGGNTQFWKDPDNIIEVAPKQGKFVFWPAGETHYHRSKPDLKSTKYILTGWVYRK